MHGFEHWEFMTPWCEWLQGRISYALPEGEGEYWDRPQRRLYVGLPTRPSANCSFLTEFAFLNRFKNLREALALLAAVAYVDNSAWRFLLESKCQVNLGNPWEEVFEESIPVQFILCIYDETKNRYPESLEQNIILSCGVDQRENPSVSYLEAMEKIAQMYEETQLGVDIEIPVRVFYTAGNNDFSPYKKSSDPRSKIAAAEKASVERYGTFKLEPMIANLGDSKISPEIAEVVTDLVANNVWFSQMSLWMYMDDDLEDDVIKSKQIFGLLLAHVFGTTRHSQELARTKDYSRLDRGNSGSDPLQLGTLHLECDYFLPAREFVAMCSALAFNQTAKKLSMHLWMNPNDQVHSELRWKWVAYAFFSKRARACSRLESLAIFSIRSMSIADVRGFSAIIASDHPEQELFGCPPSQVDERDVILKPGALIYWQRYQGYPSDSYSLAYEPSMGSFQTFSDDGTSEWVNILVPGYGRCQVQRNDLASDQDATIEVQPAGLTSLKLSFDKDEESVSDGLQRFLEVVGPSLKVLTLDGPRVEMDEAVILKSCPSLEELSLLGCSVDLRLNFSDYFQRDQPFPSLTHNIDNIANITQLLSDENSPLTKCVRRLRVRLTKRVRPWWGGTSAYDNLNFDRDIDAVLQMLLVNHSLEYLEVVVPPDTNIIKHDEVFRQYHRQPLNRQLKPLSMKARIAFLSVFDSRSPSSHLQGKKQRKSGPLRSLCELNQNVVAKIFKFAAVPVTREFYLRVARNDWKDERIQVFI